MTYQWWNQYNLGDCFWHCLFMRKLAIQQPDDTFVLFCKSHYVQELTDVVRDVGNVLITQLDSPPNGSIPCWIGPFHRDHQLRNDIVGFLIKWFDHLALLSGVTNPIRSRRDLICDYPRIFEARRYVLEYRPRLYDWMVINSQPMSGQFAHDHGSMVELVASMLKRNPMLRVVTTVPTGISGVDCTQSSFPIKLTVTEIGALSTRCENLIAVATGPIWPTFNIWNQRRFKHRLILLNEITINYGDDLPHFGSVAAASQYLQGQGVI